MLRELPEQMSDVALAMAVSRYDQQALAEVYRRHGGPVLGLARRLLSDETLADDVVQTVFVRFWERPDQFDPDRGVLRSFLMAQAHSRSVDLIRAESARWGREDLDTQRKVETAYDLERDVMDLVTAERVRGALSQLVDGERRAIELAYFGGLTYQQVAVELDQPEGTVKSRIRAGLKKLHVELADDDNNHTDTLEIGGSR